MYDCIHSFADSLGGSTLSEIYRSEFNSIWMKGDSFFQIPPNSADEYTSLLQMFCYMRTQKTCSASHQYTHCLPKTEGEWPQ